MRRSSRSRKAALAAAAVGIAAVPVLGAIPAAQASGAKASASASGTLVHYQDRTVGSVTAPNGDNNPYGVAVVPLTTGKLVAGNLLVADFNNKAGAAGGGTSILQVDPATGASSVFISGLPVSGPVGLAINPTNDGVWIGDFGATDGSNSNVLLVSPAGTVLANFNSSSTATPVTSGQQPTFDGVWGQGVSQIPGQVSFYYGTTGSGATGSGGGEVWRLDPHPTGTANGQPVHSTYVELATGLGDNATAGASNLPVTAANAAGPQGFAYDPATGTLYVTDDANNTVYAIPGAATATGPVTPRVVLAGGALNIPENIAIDPATGGLLVANAGNNTLVEINPTSGAVTGSRVLDTGAAGALFGLTATTDANRDTVISYVDDNTNTLHQLVSSPPQGSLASLRDLTLGSVTAPNGDNNPYGVAVVPLTTGKLVAGNLLVADFNNKAGAAGGGTSILQVDPATGASSVFISGLPVSGPVGLAINPTNDGVWIGDFGATDGSNSNVLLVSPAGTVLANFNSSSTATPVTSGQQPTFDGVWGQGVSQIPGQVSFYYGTTGSGATGSGGGEVWRLDPHPTGTANGQPVHSTYVELATGLGDNATAGASNLPVTAANAAGPQGFAYDPATGTLYVTDDANNTVYAIPGAATATGPVTPRVVLAGGALNIPENIAIDPATGGLLVANAGNNTLVEINPTSGAVTGSRVLDTGAAGALFGLTATTDGHGDATLYYVDDNTNTVHELTTGRGLYHPLTPVRVLDTRTTHTPVVAGSPRTLTLAGVDGIPAGATAVAINVTAVNATTDGNVAVYPAGQAPATRTSQNQLRPGAAVANLANVALGSGGAVTLSVSHGSADLVVDVQGYYTDAAAGSGLAYTAMTPARVLDTRTAQAPVAAGSPRTVQVAGVDGVPATATAVAVNVTAAGSTRGGNLEVYPAGQAPTSRTSVVNFAPGSSAVANLAEVALGSGGALTLSNAVGATQVVLDVVGYYAPNSAAGSVFTGITPVRVLDTRAGTPVAASSPRAVPVAGVDGIPATATAVAVEVTTVTPAGNGNIELYPTGQAPAHRTSTVNLVPGQDIANQAVVGLGSGGSFTVSNAAGSVNVVVDVVGYYTS